MLTDRELIDSLRANLADAAERWPIAPPVHTHSPLYLVFGDANLTLNGRKMSQNAVAPGAWATAIIDARPARVIEIGTSKGGFSVFLGELQYRLQGELITVDVNDCLLYQLPHGSIFRQWDCFEHEAELAEMIGRPGKTFVLCDGGNKPKELATFSPHLKVGDVIAAHDYANPELVDDEYPLVWGCAETYPRDVRGLGLRTYRVDLFRYSAWVTLEKHGP